MTLPDTSADSAAAKTLTIRDVARALGISKTTVSRAFTGSGRIAPQTRDTILQAARDMGFNANPHAQRLGRGTSRDLIGLFCPGSNGGVGGQKCLHVQRLLDQQGFDVPLYTSGVHSGSFGEAQADSLRRLIRQRPRMIIAHTINLEDAALAELRRYGQSGGAVVCFDVPVDFPGADSVVFDRDDNTFQATRCLLDAGHRKLGLYVVGHPLARPLRDRHLPARVAGFRRALQTCDLEPQGEWLFSGMDSEANGADLAAQFLALPSENRPSGMVIVNENVASAFINEVQRAGLLVPRNVSVVSHDDLPVARFAAVPLTTVSQPVEAIAAHVARVAGERLENPAAPLQQLVVRGHLVVRDSVAAPLS